MSTNTHVAPKVFASLTVLTSVIATLTLVNAVVKLSWYKGDPTAGVIGFSPDPCA